MTRVILGETSFDTKDKAKEYFRGLLWNGQLDERVPEPAATDLFHLFQRHPKVIAKQGIGIAHFIIRETIHGARGFEVVWEDGSTDIPSFYRCLEPPRSLQRKICDALRLEIEEEIWERKKAYFAGHGDALGRVPCADTGKLITLLEAHAHHAPPWTFAKIRNAFVSLYAQSFGHNPVVSDGYLRECLSDRALAALWCAFHWERADICYTSGPANIASARKGAPSREDTQLSFKGLSHATGGTA